MAIHADLLSLIQLLQAICEDDNEVVRVVLQMVENGQIEPAGVYRRASPAKRSAAVADGGVRH